MPSSPPLVAACCVVAGPDPDPGEVPVAFVVPQPGVALVDEAIRNTVLGRLARIYVPHVVHFLEALPENALGKVD